MRLAVTSQNFRTITGHAGKTRRFLIFEADGNSAPVEVDRLDLPVEMTVHSYHEADHPLFGLKLDGVITQSAGDGFIARLGRHGIKVHATSETDPMTAVATIASGKPLPEAPPHDHGHH